MSNLGAIRSRPWRSADDLRLMTGAVSAEWAGPRRPLVPCTAGDLEWWTALGGPDADWPARIRLWEDGGRVVAWAWFNTPTALDWFVTAALGSDVQAAIRDDILEWHRGVATAAPVPAGEDRSDAAAQLEVWAPDGSAEADHVVSRGWTATDVLLTQYHQPLDVEIELPRLAEGYRLRTMRGPQDIPDRVEIHRAAFAPSKMTVEKYEILVRQDHYAFDRDVVIEAPDGSFAAFTMAWADPAGSIGELEPVGTHPDHQRRGLGRVVTTEALRRLRAAGLRDAMVFSLRSNTPSEALYRSVGFREIALHRRYTQPLG